MNNNINTAFYKKYSFMDKEFGSYNFYIHRHMNHIGIMAEHANEPLNSVQNTKDIANAYSALSKQRNNNNETIVSEAVKQHYMDLLQSQIKSGKGILEYFSKIEEKGIGNYSDSLVRAINEHLEQYFQQNLTAEYIASLIQNSNKIQWNRENLENKLNSLNQKDLLKELDNIIQVIKSGVGILSTVKNTDKELFTSFKKVLENVKKNKYTSSQNLGTDLVNKLNYFHSNYLNGGSTSVKALRNLIESLIIVAKQLKYNKSGIKITDQGLDDLSESKDLTLQSFKRTFDTEIFPVGFGETAAGLSIMQATSAIEEALMMEVNKNHMHYTGKDKGFLEIKSATLLDPQGNPITLEKYKGTQESLKVDIKQQNVEMHIFVTGEKGEIYELKFIMDLGFSAKTYRNKAIIGDKGWGNTKVSLGGGITLGAAIMSLPIKNYIKYLGFNAITFNKKMKSAYDEIKKVVLMRSIPYLVASRNSKDFAQYMIVNGMIVSTWDIITYVLNNIDKILEKPESAGVKLSIDKEAKQLDTFTQANKDEKYDPKEMFARVKAINDIINTMNITGKVAPKRVLQWAGKMS